MSSQIAPSPRKPFLEDDPFQSRGPIQPTAKFRSDLRTWLVARREYAALVEAVAKDKPLEVLRRLAADAGCGPNEICDLQNVRRNAKKARDEIARLPQYKRELAGAESRIAALEEALRTGGDEIAIQMALLDLPFARSAKRDAEQRIGGVERARGFLAGVAGPLSY